MAQTPANDTPGSSDGGIKGILEWLALTRGLLGADNTSELLLNLQALRAAPISDPQRAKLLDLFYAHCEHVVQHELQQLNAITLPVPRRIRQRIKRLLELLETLTQDYFNIFATLPEPESHDSPSAQQQNLYRATQAIAWQIRIHYLTASSPRQGLWQQLHSCFRNARQHGVAQPVGAPDRGSIQRLYTDTLLLGIAQPASFSAEELSFVQHLIELCPHAITLLDHLPEDTGSTFWIDLERDFPAHALVRRTPPSDLQPVYFCADRIASFLTELRQHLADGISPQTLQLPELAASTTGQGVLRRLEQRWGQPAKRKFPRRRHSHRVNLYSGLEPLSQLFGQHSPGNESSEWMITNESPDGFALMHMQGNPGQLHIGDLVALRPTGQPDASWLLCLVRWAISENPEHLELGLQLLASKTFPTRLVQEKHPTPSLVTALYLPATPPLRNHPWLITPAGFLGSNPGRIIALFEQENIAIHEYLPSQINEQTGLLEIFSIQPADEPLPAAP